MRNVWFLVLVAVGLLLPRYTFAQTVAYADPVYAGNQAWTGNLGLDFNVNQSIIVTALGAFDNNANGFLTQKSVGIFNRNTLSLVGSSCTIPAGTGSTLIGGDRFCTVTAFFLAPGNYSIVAVGFNSTDQNGNDHNSGFMASTENTGGGAITFTGTGRFDASGVLDFPSDIDTFTITNGYNAGTFQFEAVVAPTLTKAFSPSSILAGQISTLTFTIANSNAAALTGLHFTDTLPTGLVIATPNGLSNTCGGTVTATAGSSNISFSGGTVAASGSCTISVNVTTSGPFGGTLTNTTSTLTSNEAPAGTAATADISIVPATLDGGFQVRDFANLNFGESYIDIINDGLNGAPLRGPGIGGAVGNICVNVYAFDPNEEMISCCSCLLTPDQVANLGVVRDITSNTATGVIPTSVTVKLLATLAGSGGSGTTCTNAAASASTDTLTNGLVAFGTTIHSAVAAGTFATTETPFISSTLSRAELASLVNRCTNIAGNLSGFGICASCRAGALGASQM